MFFPRADLHFTGIGGIGMSGLAEIALARGCRVAGSDLKRSAITERLESLGAKVYEGHAAANVSPEAAAVIYTSAAAPDNPELLEARRRGLPLVLRGEFLAQLMAGHRALAVAGSHGKTTTTSMVAAIALHAGLDPTVAVGGRLPALGGSNARAGAGEWFIAESDESDGSFLELSPEVAVITNIDREHMDHYGTMESVRAAFLKFANKPPFHGRVIACLDDAALADLLPSIRRKLLTYGRRSEADYRMVEETLAVDGGSFTLLQDGQRLGRFSLPMLGSHSLLNAAAAVAAALAIGASVEQIREALAAFRGPARRMEIKGEARGVTVVDDYGHHPTEIRATLAALRLARPKRLIVLFQPHRYTRTRSLWDEFGGAFRAADAVRITELYAASEKPIEGVSGQALTARVREAGHPNAEYAGSLEESARSVAREAQPGDLILTLGAGTITGAGSIILGELRKD
jgi:UDP-N-acetylmuramate--alanine ligase